MILDSRTRSTVIVGNLGLSHESFRVTLDLNALFCVDKLNNSKQRYNGTSIAYWTVQCRLGAASFVQLTVSPGSTPRPSLSVEGDADAWRDPGVAGVYAPAFVERS